MYSWLIHIATNYIRINLLKSKAKWVVRPLSEPLFLIISFICSHRGVTSENQFEIICFFNKIQTLRQSRICNELVPANESCFMDDYWKVRNIEMISWEQDTFMSYSNQLLNGTFKLQNMMIKFHLLQCEHKMKGTSCSFEIYKKKN